MSNDNGDYKVSKYQVTVTNEMDDLIKELSSKTRRPIASIIREALEEYFEKRGHELDASVQWGGNRKPDEK